MKKVKASVIIPTSDRLPVLKACIFALLNQTVEDFEIILIDDASRDGTREFIEDSNFSKVRYFRLEQRKGPYYARNLGIKEAKGEIIIFIDSDVVVFPDFVEDHLEIHDRREDLVVQGMVRHIETLDEVNFNRFYLPNALCLRTFITQNVSLRRKYLIAVGGFELFGPELGYKDIDLGFRLMDLRLKWVYGIRKCKAFHIDGELSLESLKGIFLKWEKQGASAYYFVKKWGNRGEKYARTKKAILFSKLFNTKRWIENENVIRLILESEDNFGLVSAFLRGLARYHYRNKGIEEARKNEGFSYSSDI
ncbi:MAG: glycosyltransferase family 2 protein [candidate division WOR-3 bacterium]